MEEIAQVLALYGNATYVEMESGAQSALGGDGLGPKKAEIQTVPSVAGPGGEGLLLTTGRSLYTSYDGAAVHSPEADKLHREESVEMNPADAVELGIADGQEVTLKGNGTELTIRARVTESVQPGTLYVPLYHEGGAVTALFEDGQAIASVSVSAAKT
jgi:predicted molibdopterin-dependent oxidoreductase YjgC